MRTLIIITLMLALAAPAMARKRCGASMHKYFRSAAGGNTIMVQFHCSGSGNGDSFNLNDICGKTFDNREVCARGWKRMTVKGGRMTVEMPGTKYPIERIYIKR